MNADNIGPLVFVGIMSLKIYLMRLPSEKRSAAWALADVEAITVWFSGLIVETAILGQPRSLCGYLCLAPRAVDNECLSAHSILRRTPRSLRRVLFRYFLTGARPQKRLVRPNLFKFSYRRPQSALQFADTLEYLAIA